MIRFIKTKPIIPAGYYVFCNTSKTIDYNSMTIVFKNMVSIDGNPFLSQKLIYKNHITVSKIQYGDGRVKCIVYDGITVIKEQSLTMLESRYFSWMEDYD